MKYKSAHAKFNRRRTCGTVIQQRKLCKTDKLNKQIPSSRQKRVDFACKKNERMIVSADILNSKVVEMFEDDGENEVDARNLSSPAPNVSNQIQID